MTLLSFILSHVADILIIGVLIYFALLFFPKVSAWYKKHVRVSKETSVEEKAIAEEGEIGDASQNIEGYERRFCQ